MKEKILIVDDEENIRFTLESFLLEKEYEVTTASNYQEALVGIDHADFDVIFADILLGVGKTGIEFLRKIRERSLCTPVIMFTGAPGTETAAEAVRLGAFDYLSKPVLKDTFLHITDRAIRHKLLVEEKERYRLNLEAIFSSVKDAIITVDKELNVLEANEASKDICNITRIDIGTSFRTLSNQCNKQCYHALSDTVTNKQSVEIHRIECGRILRPQQVVSVATYPLINNKGLFSGAILVVNDETQLVTLERELKERQQFHHIIGKSDTMQEIYSLIENLADVQSTILITGESGTGKELVSEAIHYKGERSGKPFVKVNCSALSEHLLESELFGHVKGSFTGATHDRMGRFQKADGGTVFLDEIGDVSPKTQLQLLRVLQDKEFERVGDSTPVKVDVRIITATNQNLQEKIKRGEFRQDLYYRLKVVEISLPPLRERRDDIPLLIAHFLKKFNNKLHKNITNISAAVQNLFMNYQWPGNIRELEHSLEHAFIVCHQAIIAMEHLPLTIKKHFVLEAVLPEQSSVNEKQAFLMALEKTAWSRMKAAKLLGLSRSTFYRKLNELHINVRIT
jgi:DNA-binding NtrC family response regulator